MSTPLHSGEMDDFAARLGRLEVIAADTRADVAAIKATLPHLATTAALASLRADMNSDIGELRAEMGELKADLTGVIARSEATLIKWAVGATIACSSFAFTAAKIVS